MTTSDIFSQIAQRMIEGLMTHSQLSDYYGFLGLEGYQECHKYRYFEENGNYKKIADYYLKHYNKLLIDQPFNNPDVIPSDWFKYTRQQVGPDVRRPAIQLGFEKWVKWEKDTKKIYEQYYQELINLNEVAAAIELKKYIADVDKELADARQEHLELEAIDYNISDIMLAQDDIKKKYKKKLKEIKL